MVGALGGDEFFRAGVGVVEFLAEFGGDDGVVAGEDDGDRSLIFFQPFLGWVLVAHDPAHGDERVVVLGDVGQIVERGEEQETGDAVGMRRGGGGGDSGADRFAEKDEGLVLRDLGDGFVGGGEESRLRGGAGACAVAGVFEDVDGERAVGRGGAEDGRVVGAVHSVACVAVGDENGGGRTRIAGRGKAAVTDRFAGRVFPRLETPGGGLALEGGRGIFRREVDHRAL